MSLLDDMCDDLPFDREELMSIFKTAPARYKVYSISKRNGKGVRVIAQSSAELKLVQKWVVSKIISNWPVHAAACAYRLRLSPAEHAKRHAKNKYLAKFDFENFFNSISKSDVLEHAMKVGDLSSDDANVVAKLLVWNNKSSGRECVSVGAPSSPALTNSMLYDFDNIVSKECERLGVIYSRYADDLAFSTSAPNVLHEVESIILSAIKEISYPKLVINKSKTVHASSKNHKLLVGLTLTPTGMISIGRERKRLLRAAVHRFISMELGGDEISWLRGMLSYVWSVEPSFIFTLLRAYGDDPFVRLDLPFRNNSYF